MDARRLARVEPAVDRYRARRAGADRTRLRSGRPHDEGVMDIALAIERNAIDWLAPADAPRVEYEQIDALLDGYESLAPLSDAAYAALIALLPIVHTEFALSEVAYFGCIVDAPEIVDVAYDGYLLGHARWFGERDGQRLLDWLAQRRRAKNEGG
ncbi:hypothetical protein BDAG_04335 [Burkholderia dolosa AU0158]|nr:hypothetical protein BDAG_04335 [Burkholderia dolosa AU0158]